jgi:hypothetical protein
VGLDGLASDCTCEVVSTHQFGNSEPGGILCDVAAIKFWRNERYLRRTPESGPGAKL